SNENGFITVSVFVFAIIVSFAINRALGPTCVVQIRTAVQSGVLLPSLSRVRRTQRILERIRPLIDAVQGTLDPENVENRLREMLEPVTTSAPTVEQT